VRVLLLTQHFPPEVTAGSFRVEAFARGLAARGHEVAVVCPVPNHPTGVVERGYRRPLVRRRVDGSRVTYLAVVTAREKTRLRRLAYYGSYAALAVAGRIAARSPDVIVASSPPLTVAAAGAVLAARHRAPLLLDVRDLWPESAVTLGELGPGRMLRSAERLERWVYERAARIVTTNTGFASRIAERAPAGASIDVIPNGTTREWLSIGERPVDRAALELPADRWIWSYAGNMGLAHGLDTAVDAAKELGDDYLLLMIGEGARRAELEGRAAGDPAVEMRSLMPPADAARHLRASDATLISERQDATVSAKLYDLCAVGRPIVAASRGELYALIEREGIGLAVPHGDVAALADAVRTVRADPALAERIAASARAFAERHLRERQAERLAELAESMVAP
jgi:colanic acid biosynthesis glycosyl transferase WcaI